MTITSVQQATASAVQINNQIHILSNVATQIQNILTNGAPANVSQGLPGFSPADIATVIDSSEMTKLQAALTAILAL